MSWLNVAYISSCIALVSMGVAIYQIGYISGSRWATKMSIDTFKAGRDHQTSPTDEKDQGLYDRFTPPVSHQEWMPSRLAIKVRAHQLCERAGYVDSPASYALQALRELILEHKS